MIAAAKRAARRAAQRAAISFAACLFLTVGLAFLTASAWLALAATLSHATVALIIGAAYTGAALVLLAWLSFDSGDTADHSRAEAAAGDIYPATPRPQPATQSALVESFMFGLDAGRRVGQKPH